MPKPMRNPDAKTAAMDGKVKNITIDTNGAAHIIIAYAPNALVAYELPDQGAFILQEGDNITAGTPITVDGTPVSKIDVLMGDITPADDKTLENYADRARAQGHQGDDLTLTLTAYIDELPALGTELHGGVLGDTIQPAEEHTKSRAEIKREARRNRSHTRSREETQNNDIGTSQTIASVSTEIGNMFTAILANDYPSDMAYPTDQEAFARLAEIAGADPTLFEGIGTANPEDVFEQIDTFLAAMQHSSRENRNAFETQALRGVLSSIPVSSLPQEMLPCIEVTQGNHAYAPLPQSVTQRITELQPK